MAKKTGHVPATFTDAGTGQTFEGGKDHLIDTGSYANYEAAGLVRAPAAKQKLAAAPAKAKARPARRSRAKAMPAPVSAPDSAPTSDAAPTT